MAAPALGATVGPARPRRGHAAGGHTARLPPHAPGGSTTRVLPESGAEAGSCRDTALPEQEGPGLHWQTKGRAGSAGTTRVPSGSGHRVTLRSWHSSAPIPIPFPFSLLPRQSRSAQGMGLIQPVPCPWPGRAHGETDALGLAGTERQEGRGPQHLAGRPHTPTNPCPQVSPPPSLRPRPLRPPGSWLQPVAAGTRGWPGSGIGERAAMAAARALAPLRAWLNWPGRTWGCAPRAGGTGEQKCCETPGSMAAAPSPPLGMGGGRTLSCRWPWGRCDPTDPPGARGEPGRGWDPREEGWLPAVQSPPRL